MASLTGAATAWAAEALSEADRQRYTSALMLLQDGHVDRGLALARQGSHPLANKIVAWFYLGRRDSDAGFSEISAFLEANPDWPGLFGLYRSEEHTSELQSLMRNSYAVFCLKKKKSNK